MSMIFYKFFCLILKIYRMSTTQKIFLEKTWGVPVSFNQQYLKKPDLVFNKNIARSRIR